MNREPAAVCHAVTKIYRRPSGDTTALLGIETVVPSGKLTALMGPSGSGKSTLLRILAGLERPTSGSVAVGDLWLSQMSTRRRRAARRSKIGFVFQRPSDNLISYLNVEAHMKLAAQIKGADLAEIPELLRALGVSHRENNRPHELSGGEQQRVAFAQAALGTPSLLLADEPTAELDTANATLLIEHLKHLASSGTSIVVATHDPEVADAADELIRLDEGKIV